MRVLVTGSGGFLGSHVAERLTDGGHEVRAFARPTNVPRWFEARGVEVVLGDVTVEADLAAACAGRDVVVHAASLVTEVAVADREYRRVNAEGSEALARAAAAAGVRRFVFVGSTSVHRPNSGRALDADTPLEPEEIYGRSKAEAERRLARVADDTGLELVIVRPSRIYGPRDTSLARVFRAIDRRRFLLVGRCDAEIDFVYVTDVAAALASAVERGRGVYLVGGPERVTLERFFSECARAVGRPLPSARLPIAPALVVARIVAWLWTRFGVEPPIAPKRFAFFQNSRVVDNSRAKADLGYEPAVSVRDGVTRTAQWYREARWI